MSIKVRVRGRGKMKVMGRGEVKLGEDLEMYEGKVRDDYKVRKRGVRGRKRLEYVGIGGDGGKFRIGGIEFR